MRLSTVSQAGRPAAGNSAPEMKYIGIMIICMTPMNDCICLMRIATAQAERGDRERQQQLQRRARRRSARATYGTCTSPATASTITPWKAATVAPPRHLPITIELRRTGATIISRRKPNSRSQTIDAAENIAVNITVMQRMPG